jgi:dTMP kinase
MRGVFIVLDGLDGSGKGAVSNAVTEYLRSDAATKLVPAGVTVITTAEPTPGPIGRLIREALTNRVTVAREAMGTLFAADRADHVATMIVPALASGAIVVCDRYELSNLCYRGAETTDGHGVLLPLFWCPLCMWESDDLPSEELPPEPWSGWVCPNCSRMSVMVPPAVRQRITWASCLLSPRALQPDLTLVLDVPTVVGAQRRAARGGDEEMYDADRTQRRVRSLYRLSPMIIRHVDRDGARQVTVLDASKDREAVAADAIREVAFTIRHHCWGDADGS